MFWLATTTVSPVPSRVIAIESPITETENPPAMVVEVALDTPERSKPAPEGKTMPMASSGKRVSPAVKVKLNV